MAEENIETLQEQSQTLNDESLSGLEAPESMPPESETPHAEEPSLEEGPTWEARILELETSLVEKSQQISELEGINQQLEANLAQHEEEATAFQQEMGQAVTKYRALMLSSAPEVPDELVRGDTLSEVEESFAQARQVVERVRNLIEARTYQERIPTGAPTRASASLSALSAREKIAHALAQR